MLTNGPLGSKSGSMQRARCPGGDLSGYVRGNGAAVRREPPEIKERLDDRVPASDQSLGQGAAYHGGYLLDGRHALWDTMTGRVNAP